MKDHLKVQGFAAENLYPKILGNEYAYKPFDIVQLSLLAGFAAGLSILYSTPIPQILLWAGGEFNGYNFGQVIIWLTATTMSLWGLQ